MTTREAFEEWFNDFHIEEMPNYHTIRDFSFAAYQAATAAALERAEKACEAEAKEIRSEGKGCHTGQYDHMADGAGRCAQAIRALKEQP